MTGLETEAHPPPESGVASNLPRATHKEEQMSSEDQLVTDPVCRMKISPADAVASIEHEGTTYYFCSQDCADSFRESPADYL